MSKSANINKPTRYISFEDFKQANPPKTYTPAIQPKGFRVELIDWGDGLRVSISKYTPNGFRGVTIPASIAGEVLEFALELLRKAGE